MSDGQTRFYDNQESEESEEKAMNEAEIRSYIKAGKHETIGGKAVTDLTYMDSVVGEYKVAGVLQGRVTCWSTDGGLAPSHLDNSDDLDMRKTHIRWVNFYRSGTSAAFLTETSAQASRSSECIATIEVTFKEGEGKAYEH